MPSEATRYVGRRPELRAEVERLLEKDQSRAGDVYRLRRTGETLADLRLRLGNDTEATNQVDYWLPVLLDGQVHLPPSIRRAAAGRIRTWLKKGLGPALQADFEAQLAAIQRQGARRGTSGPERTRSSSSKEKLPWPAELPADTDEVVLAKARKEQDRLRDYLLGGRIEAPCALCGRTFGKDLRVAAHIRPRRHLDHAARMDFSRIAMLACGLGCDTLFERGHLTVDEDGTVCSRSATGDLGPVLATLAGRPCLAYNEVTAPAFAIHRAANVS